MYVVFSTPRDFIDAMLRTDILRTTGLQKLGWMAMYVRPRGRFDWALTSTTTSGFGRYMANSPMVVVWPSRGADGNYNSVTLSQRKAPYETMPKPDPHPPFTARLSKIDTWVRLTTRLLCARTFLISYVRRSHWRTPK